MVSIGVAPYTVILTPVVEGGREIITQADIARVRLSVSLHGEHTPVGRYFASWPELRAAAKGNLMEEEWGIPAGGGRTESWAPPDVGSAQAPHRRCTAYRSRPGPPAEPPSHFRCTVYRPGPPARSPSHFPPIRRFADQTRVCGDGLLRCTGYTLKDQESVVRRITNFSLSIRFSSAVGENHKVSSQVNILPGREFYRRAR
jgi:hypothetical protein